MTTTQTTQQRLLRSRASTGVVGLQRVTGGGPAGGSTTLFCGPNGTAKKLLTSGFLLQAVAVGGLLHSRKTEHQSRVDEIRIRETDRSVRAGHDPAAARYGE